MKQPRPKGSTRGFSRASNLMQTRIRQASESRGFAVSRLLTHWEDVVGQQIAQTARPVNVSYGRGGMGATLTLLTTGSMAPIVEMQKEQILQKVNACYGYRAISRIKVTQTAPTGFAEGQVAFKAAPKKHKPEPSQQVVAQARAASENIKDEGLRRMIEMMATNVLNKPKS